MLINILMPNENPPIIDRDWNDPCYVDIQEILNNINYYCPWRKTKENVCFLPEKRY